MSRHLPRLLLTGALLSPVTLYALGLGEIRLSSALNQPFDAEIELISPTSDELTSLKVGLASAEMFARYGIDRPAFLGSLDFSVGRGPDGRASIKVRSNRSITEPFVTLLVEASWARGRLLREYTVLLDPPTFMPAQPSAAAPVATPQSGARTDGTIERGLAAEPQPAASAPVPAPERAPAPPPAPVAQSAPAPAPAPAPASETPAPQASAPGGGADVIPGGRYNVRRNDTLWRIAHELTPGSPGVVNRTMIALFRANPEAFGGNINRLQAGSILRIPELTEIEAISSVEASAEVARQAAEWSGATPSEAAEAASRLRLVTPAEAPAAPTDAAPAPATRAEASASSASPSAAATSADRRLQVASPDLAGVQQNVAPAQDSPAEPQAAAPASPDSAPDTSSEVSSEPSQPAQPAAEPSAEPAPAASAPRAATPASEPSGPGLLERIGDYWWVLVALGLLLVVGVLLSFVRRRREASADELDTFPAPAPDAPDALDASEAAPATAAAAGWAHEDADEPWAPAQQVSAPMPRVEDADGDADREPEEDVAAPVAERRVDAGAERASLHESDLIEPPASLRSEDTLSSESAVRFDQQDALAEADFHMAYGLYDQAADLVKIAIGREPQRRELKLKLLEIYFVWGNREPFLETARELQASRVDAAAGEWDKVAIMGRQIAPEDPMFQAEAGAAHVDLVDVNLEGGENRVDVDLFAEPETDSPAGLDLELVKTGEHAASRASDAELDFLLDEPGRGTDEDPTREMDGQVDPLARTQETPTIESPMLGRGAHALGGSAEETLIAAPDEQGLLGQTLNEQTGLREHADRAFATMSASDQTAELSIDDLGLDVDALEHTGSLEGTTSIETDPEAAKMLADEHARASRAEHDAASLDAVSLDAASLEESNGPDVGDVAPLRDDEMTQLAPSLSGFDRTMQAPRAQMPEETLIEPLDGEGTSTIYLDQVDLAGGETIEQRRPDVDSTASMKMPEDLQEIDLDLGQLDADDGGDTVERPRPVPVDAAADADSDQFSREVFAEHTAETHGLDLDVGEPLSIGDHEPTNKQLITELELSELEPVTMSEVGTKLDLARAYMDMGDPDGARSILDEVLTEGNPGQKQEAQRLMDSIR